MLQDILNWTLLTSSDVQVGPSEAQSLNGLHSQLSLLDPETIVPLAWGELVVIVPVGEMLFRPALHSANLLKRM